MKENLKKALVNVGLSEKETELYIFLSRKGPLSCGKISSQLKINKGQVYRTLKRLQKKGVIELTLEQPSRFVAVSFKNVIESFIKARREEVKLFEETKEDLLYNWKKIRQTEIDSSPERFSVIEGKKKIFNKISQMIEDTKNQFSIASNVSRLIQAEQLGIFESIHNNPLKSRIRFRFLTQVTKENLKSIKFLLTQMDLGVTLHERTTEQFLPIFPTMVIRDKDEILLFISNESDIRTSQQIESVLCTNCKPIIQSFYFVFEDLWEKSSNLKQKINELETGILAPKMDLIKDGKTAKRLYYSKLKSAKKEILFLTPPDGLIGLSNNIELLKGLKKRGISIRVMSPIISENLLATQKLLDYSEVKHIPIGYAEMTIIDDEVLFQFNNPPSRSDENSDLLFNNVFFTNDKIYIEKTKTILYDIWSKTRTPSTIIINPLSQPIGIDGSFSNKRVSSYRKMVTRENEKNYIGALSESEVLSLFKNAESYPIRKTENSKKKPYRYFGSGAFSVISLPRDFGLPTFIISLFKNNEKSCFGKQDWMIVHLPINGSKEFNYVPVALVQNTRRGHEFRKVRFSGSPVQNNIHIVNKHQLKIQTHGNSLFAGWTIDIPLFPSLNNLPPSCILFEGYGQVKSGQKINIKPWGKREVIYNSLEAFTTFFHPSSKYSGSGNEGYIERELIITNTPNL